jgi:DNA-binding YbaB/EbfC family protein
MADQNNPFDPKNMNFNDLMSKAKEMQSKMLDMQDQIANMTTEGKSGGGLVKLTMRGNHYANSIAIDKTLLRGLSQDDIEMLQDLIVAAINDCADKIEKDTKNQITALAGEDMPKDLLEDQSNDDDNE